MRYFFNIGVLLLFQALSAQSISNIDNKKDTVKNHAALEEYTIVCGQIEIDAEVRNPKHWQDYLTENLKLSSLAQDTIPDGIYKIRAIFIIDKDGCIINVKVQNDPGYGLGEKVIKVISCYKEKWYPAIRNGRNVKAYKLQDVTLVVENKKCKHEDSNEFIL